MHEWLLLGATQEADVNELCKAMWLIFTLVAIAFATPTYSQTLEQLEELNLLKEANRQINEFEDKMLQEENLNAWPLLQMKPSVSA